MTSVIEMRMYWTKPGKRSTFLEIFTSKSVPAHVEIGMGVIGPFLSLDDENAFFWMRCFPDRSSREPMKNEFYEGKLFKEELEHLLLPMLERYEVMLLEDAEGLWSSSMTVNPARFGELQF
jgi:hypothetical protein